MTSIEQAAVIAFLTVAAIVATQFYPHEPDLRASTRAMLRGGFEGRTEIITAPEIKSTREMLRGSI